MGLVSEVIEQVQVELGHRCDTQGPQLVDPGPHPPSHHGDLIGRPTANGVGKLEADQLRQAAQRQHPGVHRLAHSGGPLHEGCALGAPSSTIDLGMGKTQSVDGVGGRPVAGCGHAATEVRQGPGPGEELLEGVARPPTLPPLERVAWTQQATAIRRSRADRPVLSGHAAGHVDAPPPDKDGRLFTVDPGIEVIVVSALELPPVAEAERVLPMPVAGATRHGTVMYPVETAPRDREDQLSVGIPLPGQPVLAHQRLKAFDAPVRWLVLGGRKGDDDVG